MMEIIGELCPGRWVDSHNTTRKRLVYVIKNPYPNYRPITRANPENRRAYTVMSKDLRS